MFCPNCGNEINENQKFCMFCGANLNYLIKRNQIINKIKDISQNKFFKIFIIIIVVFSILVSTCIFKYNSILNNMKKNIIIELPNEKQDYSEYKSIKSLWKDIDTLKPKQALDLITQQENDLKEFFSQNHSKDENSQLFSTFYQNAVIICQKIDKILDEQNWDIEDIHQPQVDEVVFSPVNLNYDNLNGYYKISNPQTELFRSIFCNTDYSIGHRLELNYIYIYNTYFKYLNKPFQEYIILKKQNQILRKNFTLWAVEPEHPNHNLSKEYMIDYIISLRKILNEYPDFKCWDYVLQDIKTYLDAFIYPIDNEEIVTLTDEQFLNLYKKFFKKAVKDTYEYEVMEQFYNIYKEENSEEKYYSKYHEWYEKTFYNDATPIISQYDMNRHSGEENKYYEDQFKKNTQKFKDLNLNDNGALINYIKGYDKRYERIEFVVFPHKNDDPQYYGSSFPMQYAKFYKLFNEFELYTYQKIADTYQNNYEHTNKIKEKVYHDYYNKIVHNILKSEYFAENMKSYLKEYDKRKIFYRQFVSKDMKDSDYSVWFDKLEIYSYKTILIELSYLLDYTYEINAIFKQ